MKSIIAAYIGKVNSKRNRKKLIKEIVEELEYHKSFLAAHKQDSLDEAYADGIDMAIHIVKELQETNRHK